MKTATDTAIRFPSGAYYVPHSKAGITRSLFTPGGTASGTYRPGPGGILFLGMDGQPEFFLVANRHGERFYVSTDTLPDGRRFYMHALTTRTENKLFSGVSCLYSAQINHARETAARFSF